MAASILENSMSMALLAEADRLRPRSGVTAIQLAAMIALVQSHGFDVVRSHNAHGVSVEAQRIALRALKIMEDANAERRIPVCGGHV